jgi:large repetitive protein
MSTTSQGGNASASPSTVIPPIKLVPVVESFDPASGAAGATVVIRGFFFSKATGVQFDGTSAKFTINSDQQITATVPKGAGTGPITVLSPSGSGMSSQRFVVVTAPPRIGSITPDAAPPGTKVMITGTQLLGATAVQFGGLSVPFNPIEEHQINVKVPAVPPGLVTVVVTNPLGFSNAYPFTVTAS